MSDNPEVGYVCKRCKYQGIGKEQRYNRHDLQGSVGFVTCYYCGWLNNITVYPENIAENYTNSDGFYIRWDDK